MSVKEKARRRSFSSPLKREAPSRLLNNLNKREMDERVGGGGSKVDCSFCRGITEGGGGEIFDSKSEQWRLVIKGVKKSKAVP